MITEWFKRNPWMRHLYRARNRCRNPKDQRYKYYGGKGITCLLSPCDVKLLWFRDGAASMKVASIDRIDPGGNYVLENCRFIERRENSMRAWRNKRRQDGKLWGEFPLTKPRILKNPNPQRLTEIGLLGAKARWERYYAMKAKEKSLVSGGI